MNKHSMMKKLKAIDADKEQATLFERLLAEQAKVGKHPTNWFVDDVPWNWFLFFAQSEVNGETEVIDAYWLIALNKSWEGGSSILE